MNGSLSADLSISVPSGVGGFWIVTNSTTDASAAIPTYVTIKSTAGGSVGVVVPRNVNTIVFSNGSEVFFAQQNTTPPGTIIAFAGGSAPTGYLFCEGSAYARTTYPNLFAAIGTTWGAGNGTTTFNVPDLRGYFQRGAGTSARDPDSPRYVGTAQTEAFASHTHTDSGHQHSYTVVTSTAQATGGSGSNYFNGSALVNTGTAFAAIQATGGAETRPDNVAVLYCIKF
jgi:microcystin-dependent protein